MSSVVRGVLAGLNRKRLSLQSRRVWDDLPGFDYDTFKNLHSEAINLYSRIPQVNETIYGNFENAAWTEFSEILAKYFLHQFDSSFLRHPTIIRTMFLYRGGKMQADQLKFLRLLFTETDLRSVLIENRLGNPYITNFEFLTSHNSIHHLYHIARYQQATHKRLTTINSVVEFGGGYGNLARMVKSINPHMTYNIVDLPIMSALQFTYLGTLFGQSKVTMVTGNAKPAAGKINLIPLPFVDRLDDGASELFISTWALSESTIPAQEYVAARKFFGATRMLVAFDRTNQLFGSMSLKGWMPALFPNVIEEPIPHLYHSSYLFS
jgi:hypothetical protein